MPRSASIDVRGKLLSRWQTFRRPASWRGGSDLQKDDRVCVRLPILGGIEVYVAWTKADRFGFQFERTVRPSDLAELVAAMQNQLIPCPA